MGRQRHYSNSNKGQTGYSILGVFVIFIAVSFISDMLIGNPCSESNPVNYVRYLMDPKDAINTCKSKIRGEIAKGEGIGIDVPISLVQYLPFDIYEPSNNDKIQRLKKYVPKDGRVSEDYIRGLPSDIKSMCKGSCRDAAKSYLVSSGKLQRNSYH